MIVHYTESAPLKTMTLPPQLTSPWAVRLVPAQTLDPTFIKGG